MKTKDVRRTEALRRNSYYQSLSILEKLAHLEGRPGKCIRQVRKLEAQFRAGER